MVTVPERDVWVYLDSTALIDLIEAIGSDPPWTPPAQPDVNDLRKIAVTRLFFYSRRPHPVDGRARYLVLSSVGRAEITARGNLDWTLSMFFDIDYAADAPPSTLVETEQRRLRALGVKENDAGHLARANLLPYIDVFVTDDEKLWKKKDSLGLRDSLKMCGVVEAAADLQIAADEQPPTAPHPSSPLASRPRWWVI
jgi:hypothetical protein